MRRKITGILVAGLLMLTGASGFAASSWAETGSTGPTRSVETNCTGSEDVNCEDDTIPNESKCPDGDTKCLEALDDDDDDIYDTGACSGFEDENGDCVEGYTTPGGSFTEVVDAKDNLAGLRFGNNLLLAGNNLKSSLGVNGLLFAAGNRVDLSTDAEYGFFAGNIVNISTWTDRDLFVAGNIVTLEADAEVGGDAYVTGNTVIVENDFDGDLSIAADTVELGAISVGGNLNVDANKIIFKEKLSVEGILNYNDDAEIVNIENIKNNSVKTYQHDQDGAKNMVALWSGKILSMLTLFLTMIVILAICRRLYPRVLSISGMDQFGNNIGLGVVALFLAPLLGLIMLCTFFLAPLGISVFVGWMIAIYLSQGFAGLWLGHMLVTRVLKSKGGFVIDSLVGIIVLGVFSLVPFIGVATGFLGMVLGLGLIVQCFRRRSDDKKSEQNVLNNTNTKEQISKRPEPSKKELGGKNGSETKTKTKNDESGNRKNKNSQ